MRYCAVSASVLVNTSRVIVMTWSSEKLFPFETLVITYESKFKKPLIVNITSVKIKKIIIYLLIKEPEFQYLFQHGWTSNAILRQNNPVPNFAHNFFKPTITLRSYLR